MRASGIKPGTPRGISATQDHWDFLFSLSLLDAGEWGGLKPLLLSQSTSRSYFLSLSGCCPGFGYQSWAMWAELISHQEKKTKQKKIAVKLLKWKSEKGGGRVKKGVAEPGLGQRGWPPRCWRTSQDQDTASAAITTCPGVVQCIQYSVIKCNRFCFPSWMWLTERGLKCVWKGLAQCSSGFKKAHINVYLESGKQRSR